jgi:hypothetical protein
LTFLNSLCVEKANDFQNIKTVCDFLNRFSNDIRYPHKYEVTESDASFSLAAVEKVRNIQPMVDVRNAILSEKPPQNT